MFAHNYPGRLILMEGMNGAGKSTQAKRTVSWLERGSCATDRHALLTKEPYTKTPDGRPVVLGEEIYQLLNGTHERITLAEVGEEAFQRFYYFPNRAQHHAEVVIPALKRGDVVISDRGLASVCFGAQSTGVLFQLMADQLAMFNARRLPWPDAVIIYDLPAELAMERMHRDGKKLDAQETLEVQQRVRENYQTFAAHWPNCHIVNAQGTEEEVFVKGTIPVLDQVLNREVHQFRQDHGIVG
jgi:dTMP kinase